MQCKHALVHLEVNDKIADTLMRMVIMIFSQLFDCVTAFSFTHNLLVDQQIVAIIIHIQPLFLPLQVSVYAPPEQKEQARFGLDVATKVIPFYGEFFGNPYPLAKSGV